MSVYRDDAEQAWHDEAEAEWSRIEMLEEIEPPGVARLRDMTYPRISVERIRPATVPQPEYEPRRTVRSHEVRSYGKTSLAEWCFLIGGITLCAAWLMLLAAVMYAVTVG